MKTLLKTMNGLIEREKEKKKNEDDKGMIGLMEE